VTGVVHLVGAGPGDPELLTVRARRLLDATDVVVHDRLISPALLATIAQGVRRYAVGKEGGGPSTPQPEIAHLLIRLARSGMDVVRLKGGDPFVFGRGGEEAMSMLAAGIPFDVVPGVTAGVAGPAAAGIPVTHRGIARSVVFVTGETAVSTGPSPTATTTGTSTAGTATTGAPPVDWAAVAAIDTAVIFMAGRSAASVAGRLIDAGRAESTPAAVIVEATLPGQTVLRLDLGLLRRHGVGRVDGRPTILVVGNVVGLGAELAGLGFAPDLVGRGSGLLAPALTVVAR
jgi:uroporphyrin-III C-methyltransferase